MPYDNAHRGFVHLSRAWYGKTILQGADYAKYTDEVMFGYYPPDGGTVGEMGVRWHNFSGYEKAPRLECFDDAWAALATMPDVIQALAAVDNQNITPEQFCQILIQCGFKDRTPTDANNEEEEEPAHV